MNCKHRKIIRYCKTGYLWFAIFNRYNKARIWIKIKRAYDAPAKNDGLRILVDRVWPRGISKEKLKLHQWAKALAPSTLLRKWFGHDPKRWEEFRRRYREELKEQSNELHELRKLSKTHTVTLIFGAKDELHNQAVVLKEIISEK